ncbi:MAG TPA: thioesterase domain-containing protein, partial [Burkholderiaceae bacterium]|nr:thioesterase domain-containing protein [Burkholderiaceae bacterium]
TVPEMAAVYIQAIRHVQANGPYRVAGWSAGGTIAFEIARQLIKAGETIEFLGLIDTTSDYSALQAGLSQPMTGDADVDDANALLANLPHELPRNLTTQLRTLAESGAVAAMLEQCRSAGMFPAGIDPTTLRRHLAVRASILRALKDYTLSPLAIPMSLFLAKQEAHSDPTLGWGALMGDRLDLIEVEGNHYSIMDKPNIQGLALAITNALSATKRLASSQV